MRRALPALPFLAIAITLVGLAASAASLADTLAPAPAFCQEGGCATVRTSAWAKPLGIPLPFVGIAFFASLLVVSVLEVPRARRALAITGAVGAIGLVALQALVIAAWCKLCLVADVSAIAAAVVLVVARRPRGTSSKPARALVFALGAAAIGAPLVLANDGATTTAAAMPDVVAREQQPGRVTVVDFIDFECPFCRALHPRLVAAIDRAQRAGVDVRVVRKMVPLAKHEGALPAAIAFCCAEKQGKGDAMAEALLAAPTTELTTAGCEQLAAAIGCDMAQFRRDAAGADVRARIDRDLADARAAGIRSLPTVYVGAHAFVGAAATTDELVAALTR